MAASSGAGGLPPRIIGSPLNVPAPGGSDGPRSSGPTEAFFGDLFARDPSGRSWLPGLLRATPGAEALGELVDDPGVLAIPLAVPGASGRLACLEFRSAPARDWLLWMIANPHRLTWPEGLEMKPETAKLRRLLFTDDPPGARVAAQERARELALSSSPNVPAWWRLEEISPLDCVLTTDRLVVVVEGRDAPAPVTPWYPPRTPIVRALEAARKLADEGRRWCSLVVGGTVPAESEPDAVAASLADAAPHLDRDGRAAMASAYLGGLTWDAARAAVAA